MSTVWPKGVDGRSQWGTGTRETEVRLDLWCEGGLRQQRNNGGGCATMREREERVESPGFFAFLCMNEFHEAILLGTVSFRTAVPCPGGYDLENGGMP